MLVVDCLTVPDVPGSAYVIRLGFSISAEHEGTLIPLMDQTATKNGSSGGFGMETGADALNQA